jgi:hypothetical protein
VTAEKVQENVHDTMNNYVRLLMLGCPDSDSRRLQKAQMTNAVTGGTKIDGGKSKL